MTRRVETILNRARAKSAKIATVESCTAGMVAAALTDIPGSSDVFDRGFVTYSNAAKIAMVGVSPQTLEKFGAVSVETAIEMADGGLAHSDASLVVSITGLAGPGGSALKPEGRVCFALAETGSETVVELHDFGALGRDAVREVARDYALDLLLARLA